MYLKRNIYKLMNRCYHSNKGFVNKKKLKLWGIGMKIIRIYTVFLVIIFGFLMNSCYKSERYLFSEGVFKYESGEIELYNDVVIKEITMSFSLDTTALNVSNKPEYKMNCIVNRKNFLRFCVELSFVLVNGETIKCDFVQLPKYSDHVDYYEIEADCSQLLNVQSAIINFNLYFKNALSGTNYAQDIWVYFKISKVNEKVNSNNKFNYLCDLIKVN